MRRDKMRDLFGRDLVHLALVLALLRLDVPFSRQPLGSQSSRDILADLDPYHHSLNRQKEVLADLSNLGRFSQPSPSGGNIGSSTNRWGGLTGQIPAPIEISAYVLNTEGDLPDGILQDVRPSTSAGLGSSSHFPASTTRIHANSESDGGHSDSASISDVDSGIENNFGDFGGYESSQSVGARSPSSVASGSECASINSPRTFSNNDFDLDLDLDLGPPIPDLDGDPFGLLSDGPLLGDTLQTSTVEQNLPQTPELSPSINLFSPDEEDVENQLMHIDDQLIRLDDDIENINEDVQRTLDQAIMVHNLGSETISEGVLAEEMEAYPFQDEDSQLGMESLLGAEEQDFLFSALEQDQSAMFTDSLLAAADGVTEVNPFDDWQTDTNRGLEDLLNGVIPPSDVRPPPPVVTESVVKTEVKSESGDNDEDIPKANYQRKIDSEPEKKVTVVKDEPLSEDEDGYDQNDETSEYVHGATADFEQDYFNNNNVPSKKEIQFGSFNSELHGSSLRQSSTEESSTASHLLDHNYAASSFDECFGESWKEEKINGASNTDFYNFFDDRSNQASPTSSIATSYEGASVNPGSTSSSGYRESRDERKVRQYGLPITCSQIIDSSMEEFNELLTRHTMTEEQISLCRDIRRRGKNKVAAQNCRKRKLNLISHLQDEVDKYRQTKQNLLAERQELYRMRNEWTNKLLTLEDQVLRGLGKSSDDYSLELMPHSQQIRIAQRHTSSSASSRRGHLTKPTRA